MRRILFRILTALSLLLLLAAIGLCIYSYVDGHSLARRKNQGSPPGGSTVHAAGVADGWMIAAIMDLSFTLHDVPDTVEWEWQALSIADIDRFESSDQPNAWRFPGFRHYSFSNVGSLPVSGWILLIHFGWLIPLFAILPTYWLFTRHREPRRRAKLGLCIKCGYDLRGSAGGVCPECGAVRNHNTNTPAQG